MTHLIFAALLVATLVAWGAADVALLLHEGYEATFSYLLLSASRRWPILPALIGLAVGILFGHLFWPQ